MHTSLMQNTMALLFADSQRRRVPLLATVMILGLLAYGLLGKGEFPDAGGWFLIGMFTVLIVLRICPVALAKRLAGEAARAAARERADIARELHDLVGHHMSVISMHAGIAEQALDSDPATARTAIETAGSSSRAALTEMRRLLKLLRPQEADDAPRPGLALLDELANRVRGVGVPVEIVVTGRRRALPPGPDLCAYRVAQESLTNVLKHAGDATARIYIDYGEDMFTLTISDTGAGPGSAKSPVVSHGLRGMRERAERHGGRLVAGRGTDGGFEVTLSLPIGEAA